MKPATSAGKYMYVTEASAGKGRVETSSRPADQRQTYILHSISQLLVVNQSGCYYPRMRKNSKDKSVYCKK